MLTHLAVFACAGALTFLIYRYDRYEKEPLLMVLLALSLGFCAMRAVGMAENLILSHLRLAPASHAPKAALVAGIEDGAKLVAVLLIACAFRRQINDPLDGIIYGTLVGLGAAVDESMLYLSLSPPTLATLGAELTRLITHAMLGGVTGFAVGIGARPDRPRTSRPMLVASCLVLSVLIHFAWDVIAYRPAATHSMAVRLALMGLMLGLIGSWGGMVAAAARRSRELFVPERRAAA